MSAVLIVIYIPQKREDYILDKTDCTFHLSDSKGNLGTGSKTCTPDIASDLPTSEKQDQSVEGNHLQTEDINNKDSGVAPKRKIVYDTDADGTDGTEKVKLLSFETDHPGSPVADKKDETAGETADAEVTAAEGNEPPAEEAGKPDDHPAFEDYTSDSFVDSLQNLFDDLGITNDAWVETDDQQGYQISFVVATENCDVILRRLTLCGLGNVPNTSITLFPASFHHVPKGKLKEDTSDRPAKKSSSEESEFFKSIKSRLIVAQVVASVENNAQATFDFILLICLASLIAALGLVENSSVVLVASMLISPLMGPILGGVFGFVIQNRKLCWTGIQNATIGLALCLLVGFIFGLLVSGANIYGTQWGSGDSWPTSEMSSRGLTRSLWIGVLIALPSGAAVALSILGGNIGSLVGVAISASLLPPAVNAGILWAYALVVAINPPALQNPVSESIIHSTISPLMNSNDSSVLNNTTSDGTYGLPTTTYPPHCPSLYENAYSFTYSCNMAQEVAILGAVSLFLTMLNILCIFLMGILVLKIKEVAPHTAINNVFWKKDLPAARGYYKTIKGKESNDLRKMMKDISSEMKDLEERGQLPEDARNVRGPMLIRSQSHDGYMVLPGINDHVSTSNNTPSEYHTPQVAFPAGIPNRTSNIFNTDSLYFPGVDQFSPKFMTPPSSMQGNKFEFPATDIRKRRPSRQRRSHEFRKQMSLSMEMEKEILQSLADGPQRFGRFMVSAIPEEEDTVSMKSNAKSPDQPAQPVFKLKAPVKKMLKSDSKPEVCVLDIHDDLTEETTKI